MELVDQKLKDFLAVLSSKKPVPGGGSASALAGAMAAALVVMVGQLTVKKKKCQEVEESFQKVIKQAEKLQKELSRLVDEDARAFLRVIESKNSLTAVKKAAEVPLKTAQKSLAVLKMACFAAEYGNQSCRSDAFCAVELATAAIYGGLENVRANLPLIEDKITKRKLKKEIEKVLSNAKIISWP